MSPLIWVHGWYMHAQVWQPLLAHFPTHRHVCLTLPGHDGQPNVEGGLDAWGQALAEGQDQGVWIGWSLGGLMALWMAQHYPERVEKVVLMAATPKFTATLDWPCGVQQTVFEAFSDALQEDTVSTLKRFMALQMLGAAQAKWVEQKTVNVKALMTGLDILKTTDLRSALSALSCPLQLVLGEKDTLISAQTAQAVRALYPKTHITVIAGAGHAPFLSHPQRVYEKMAQFV